MESYFKFGKYIVYVTRTLLNKVYEANLMRKDLETVNDGTHKKEDSPFKNQDSNLNTLVYETLNREYSSNLEEFYNKWVKFDVSGEILHEDILYYLDSYCRLNKNPYLIDDTFTYNIEISSLVYGITASYEKQKFYLAIPSYKGIKDIFINKSSGTCILIDIKKVKRIVGDCDAFDVIFENDSFISCGKLNIIVTL